MMSKIHVSFVILLITTVILMMVNYKQTQTINSLIELNHDKSLYIDSGCPGHYQGAEELLPGEKATQQ